MKTLVFGTGGVGGYFGGMLAKAGCNTTFIARGTHLEALKNKGLTVKSYKGDFTIKPVQVTNNITDVNKVDLIILAVKSWQVQDVAKMLLPVMHKETVILPLQNGADNADKIAQVVGKEHVLGGLCKIISFVEAPGVINHKAYEPEIVLGELNNKITDRVKQIKNLFDTAGVKCTISDAIQVDIWKKFLFITTVSGMGALTRVPISTFRKDNNIRELLKQTALEIIAVANAKQIPIPEAAVNMVLEVIDSLAEGATASMQRDIMQGKPSELDNFNGYIVAQGEKLGVKTPVNAFIYHCLRPIEQLARSKNKV